MKKKYGLIVHLGDFYPPLISAEVFQVYCHLGSLCHMSERPSRDLEKPIKDVWE